MSEQGLQQQHNRGFAGICILAILMMILSGVVFRLISDIGYAQITLPVPLKSFPMDIAGWSGSDVEISATVLEVAANDDFLNRHLEKKIPNQWVNLYVGYSARPRTMIGHRPRVCYPAHGWDHVGTDEAVIKTSSGVDVPCLVHRFRQPLHGKIEIVVLNFYVVNGKLTNDEKSFSGLSWRTPNIGGKIARYVAQVQISSSQFSYVEAAVRDVVDELLRYLPDENHEVSATLSHEKLSDM